MAQPVDLVRFYKPVPLVKTFFAVALLLLRSPTLAQSSDQYAEVPMQGKRYLEIKLHNLSKFEARQKRLQERLLAKLSRTERRLKSSFTGKDSAQWQRIISRTPSFDSISVLAKRDSSSITNRYARRLPDAKLDSLRGVLHFITESSSLDKNSGVQATIPATVFTNYKVQ